MSKKKKKVKDQMAINGLIKMQNRTRQREAEKMLKDWKKSATKVQAVFRGMQVWYLDERIPVSQLGGVVHGIFLSFFLVW
jgi:uncharacterized membrane protein